MDNKLYEIALKKYNDYLFINIDRKLYLSYVKKNISTANIEEFESRLNKFFIGQVTDCLKENKEETISNYINFVSNDESYYKVVNSLRKINHFLVCYKINSDLDLFAYLIENNDELNNLLKIFVNKNINIIKNDKLFELNISENIITMIEIYCNINDIEIKEDFEIESISTIENQIGAYYNEIKKYPLLTFKDQQEIFKKIETGDKEAKDFFIKCNLRLVFKYIRKYHYPNIDIWDLIQEGNIGLMKAVDKFDYTKGYKFSTYATWWIRESIAKYIDYSNRSFKIPEYQLRKVKKYKKIKENLERKLQREATIDEIANEMNETIDTILKIEFITSDAISLNNYTTIGEMNDELIDFIPSDDREIEEEVMGNLFLDEIRTILNNLNVSNRNKEVFELRYGLNGDSPKTLEEVGEIFNITRERVRQIENNIISKIKLYKKNMETKNEETKGDTLDDYVINNLAKVGPKEKMCDIFKFLTEDEKALLKLVFGRADLKDGSVPIEKEMLFYNCLIPKIKKIYKSLQKYNIDKSPEISHINDENISYDKITSVETRRILRYLKKQIPDEFYSKISTQDKVILGFYFNKLNKNITNKSLAEYFGVSEELIIIYTDRIINYYKEYLANLDNKKYKI
ncbi:MAG: RNA polymerase sigma factor RpoD/SigA [Bacilli bacterium]|nr:RNA polymerase sigma factor RpoD/SigA [Bacilli bacterium]